MTTIQVQTLGQFSLTAGEVCIRDTDTRSKKIWSLLAYLIQFRGTPFSQQRLMELFWGEDASNPENALRITLHRLRAQLDRLWPGAGRTLILYRDGSYCWNESVPICLDCETFEYYCRSSAEDPQQRLDQLLSALALYRGDYLPRQASELWAVPLSTHFSNLFLTASVEAAQLLSRQERHREAAALCRTAAISEPYHEGLHILLMQELAADGDTGAATAVYDGLSRRLFDEFGILPGEEIRSVYRSIAGMPEDRALPIEEVLGHIQEPPGKEGAMQCDYDHFKVLCYAQSRALERTGGITHVALLHLSASEKPLSRRSRNRIMEWFGQTLQENLRRGDVISRCSTSQYIILLPNANYENSCMVCRRVTAAFRRKHPHVTADIHFLVQPLIPDMQVP